MVKMYSLLIAGHGTRMSFRTRRKLAGVAGCCSPTDYRRLFSRKYASRDAMRYRKRGLTGSSRALVALAGDVRGASVLDVGGGIGAIELELLAGGAERATNVRAVRRLRRGGCRAAGRARRRGARRPSHR